MEEVGGARRRSGPVGAKGPERDSDGGGTGGGSREGELGGVERVSGDGGWPGRVDEHKS